MTNTYKDFLIRNWEQSDRTLASQVIHCILSEYGLGWEPNGADRDVLQVEECYLETGGEFWVIEHLASTKDSSEITNLQASEGRLRSFSRDFSRQANIIEHQNQIVGTSTKDSSEITNLQASEGRLRSFSRDFSRQANIIEHQNQIVGTAAYYPIHRGEKAVEIRKMYLLPSARGLGLGKYLLQQLENAIASRGFQQIWIETASVLAEAVKLYESNGYEPATGVETARCDRVYVKKLSPLF
jgi:GNAT superfamily N-acetyltransferase